MVFNNVNKQIYSINIMILLIMKLKLLLNVINKTKQKLVKHTIQFDFIVYYQNSEYFKNY